ncbi:MAG: polysaccharide deacetylase family protein [Armatimonadota bacterium]
MSRALSVARTALLAGCALWPVNGSRGPSVPILIYHSIDGSGSPVSVTPSAFRRQMAWLAARRYRPLTMADVAAALQAGRLPERAVVITFDDAYRNVFEVAVPCIRELGLRATVFVATAKAGGDNGWSSARIPRMPIASWDEIAIAVATSTVEVGGHSRTHPKLSRLSREDARREVEGARDELRQRLGVTALSFCYPYGNVNAGVREIVSKAGYQVACTTRWGHACAGDDPFMLRRIRVYHEMLFPEFRASLTPAVERCRQLMGPLRPLLGRPTAGDAAS